MLILRQFHLETRCEGPGLIPVSPQHAAAPLHVRAAMSGDLLLSPKRGLPPPNERARSTERAGGLVSSVALLKYVDLRWHEG